MTRLPLIALLPLTLVSSVGADHRQLLESAVEAWGREIDRWSFMQEVREFRGGSVSEARTERFDPSRSDTKRWELVEINSRAPTLAELRAFDARKNRKPRHRVAAPVRYIDFDRVTVVEETSETITFDVPLRGDVSFFIPFESVAARIVVDRNGERVRQITVRLLEEMRIAFGFVRVTRLEMEFHLDDAARPRDVDLIVAPPAAPLGRASATMSKFGRRAEFSWSHFVRVGS